MKRKSGDKAPSGPKTPEWAIRPFEDFIKFTQSFEQVVDLTISGISGVRAYPKVVSAFALANAENSADTRTKFKRATKLAALAQQEVKNGFPLIHAYASVTL